MASQFFRIQEHVLPCQHIRHFHRATIDAEDDVLHLAIKQYTPLDNSSPGPDNLTIIGAHANGFPKELYEPLWIEIYRRCKSKGINLRGVWIADAAHQGLSGVLNEGKLGDDPGWFDHSLDLLHMINHFRKDIRRPILGIGHSMGGAQLVKLSLVHPRIFTSLVLLDPVIQPHPTVSGQLGPTRASSFRRDIWPSREAAALAFKKNKFYQAWDPRVLELWIKFGLRDLPTLKHPISDSRESPKNTQSLLTPITTEPTVTPELAKPVTLTTTKDQEVFTYVRHNYVPDTPGSNGPYALTETNLTHNRVTHPDIVPMPNPQTPFYRSEPIILSRNLPFVSPSVLYIVGEKSQFSTEVALADKLENTGRGVGGSGGAAEGKVKVSLMANVGHLVPMEDVNNTAEQITQWLEPALKQWTLDEKEVLKSWEGKERHDRYQLGEKWLNTIDSHVKGLLAAKSKKSSKI